MSDRGEAGSGYVHDPDRFDDAGERVDGDVETDDGRSDRPAPPERLTTKAYTPDAPDSEGFGARGWFLVAALFVSFLVIPGLILFLPQLRPVIADLGLPFRDAYLVLPLLPALGLASLAVWVALTGSSRNE